MNRTYLKSLYGFTYSNLVNIKTPILICFYIILFMSLVNLIFGVAIKPDTSGYSSQNIGILTSGSFIIYITLIIVMLVNSLSKDEFKADFSFPVSKSIYITGKYISAVYLIIILLSLFSIFHVIMDFILKLKLINNEYYTVNSGTNISLYLKGLMGTFSTAILLSSISHLAGSFASKYLKTTSTILIGFISLIIFSDTVNIDFSGIIKFFFYEQNLLMYFLKCLLTSVILFSITYIPISRKEVI
jgi:hypothetical protein